MKRGHAVANFGPGGPHGGEPQERRQRQEQTGCDGKQWNSPEEVAYPVVRSEQVLVRDYTLPFVHTDARYIKVVARNVGVCPSWHSGAGDKAWLFVDEIIVQ